MKDKLLLLLYAVVIGAVLYLIFHKTPPEKKVGTEYSVMDSIYNKNKAYLTSFSDGIENLDAVKNFKSLTIKEMGDDAEEEMTEWAINALVDSTFLAREYKFNAKTSCMVYRTTNMDNHTGIHSDSIIAAKKHPIELSFLTDEQTYMQPDNRLWQYHLDDSKPDEFHNDSIYADDKTRIIENSNKFLKALKEAKYIVIVTDTYYMKPKMATDKGFESGILITNVDVYTAKDKKKIGHKTLLTTNSDKIKVMALPMGDDELKMKLYFRQIESDLASNREEKVMAYLKRDLAKE